MHTLTVDWAFDLHREVKDGNLHLGSVANAADWRLIATIFGQVDDVRAFATEDGFTIHGGTDGTYEPRVDIKVEGNKARLSMYMEAYERHETEYPHRYADRVTDDYSPHLAEYFMLRWAQFLRTEGVPFDAQIQFDWEEYPPVENPLPQHGRSLVVHWAGKALGLY